MARRDRIQLHRPAPAVRGPNAAAADSKIKNHEVDGAILVAASGPEVHVASAASPTVAQLLSQAEVDVSAMSRPADRAIPRK